MKKLITIFKEIAQIYSPSGNETEMSSYLLTCLKHHTDITRKDAFGNVYARINGKGDPLFFSAHMDTVEPGKNIQPQIKKGFLVSDGKTILGADNKSTLACLLTLAEKLYLAKLNNRPVEFIFTRSEETGNYGAINFDYSLLKAKTGYCFDSVLPVGSIITASPFYERFDITLFGKAAHASKPEEAKNALLMLNELLNGFKLGRIDEDILVNIGAVSGGTVRNTIPGEIKLQGEIRSFVESKITKVKNHLNKTLNKLTGGEKGKYQVEYVQENPGYKLSSTSIKRLIEVVAKKMLAIKIAPKLIDAWGVSDANIFNEKGLTCINLGDGVENAHTVNERIKITDLEKILKLMLSLVAKD